MKAFEIVKHIMWIEAIRTERFNYKKGYHVVPSAKAANYTMNRKAIRDLAATELEKQLLLLMQRAMMS